MEVSVMHRVQHPGIVKFLGAAFEEDRLAYVLEYCKNGSLSFLLVREDVSMSWERRLGWARSIAEAVQYLHGLKPKVSFFSLFPISFFFFFFFMEAPP